MLEEALSQIPLRSDVYTNIFLISTFQSFFLGAVILFQSRLKNQILNLLGVFLLMIGALMLDLYWVRTGLMKYHLWYNDITEWMVLGLGPSLYLISVGLTRKTKLAFKELLAHAIAPILYLGYQLFDILQPDEHHYNAYVNAFHPKLQFLEYSSTVPIDPLCLKENFERILLVSIIGYAIAGFYLVIRSEYFPSWSNLKEGFSKYTFVLWAFVSLIVNGVALLFLFIFLEEDTSHLYVGILISLEVFILAMFFLTNSTVFSSVWISDKYDTAGLGRSQTKTTFELVDEMISKDQLYLDSKLSLSVLSASLEIPAHHISQSVNSVKKINFNEYVNGYRVKASIELLQSKKFDHLNLEGIGRQVGFSSKSAFYNAFKKETGSTPGAYKS